MKKRNNGETFYMVLGYIGSIVLTFIFILVFIGFVVGVMKLITTALNWTPDCGIYTQLHYEEKRVPVKCLEEK